MTERQRAIAEYEAKLRADAWIDMFHLAPQQTITSTTDVVAWFDAVNKAITEKVMAKYPD